MNVPTFYHNVLEAELYRWLKLGWRECQRVTKPSVAGDIVLIEYVSATDDPPPLAWRYAR